MKKETLRRQWLLYGSGLDWQLGAVAVFWLLIEGITAVALAITKETTTVILSAMICLILLAFVSVFTGFQRVNRVLTLGIALGSTRRAEALRCLVEEKTTLRQADLPKLEALIAGSSRAAQLAGGVRIERCAGVLRWAQSTEE